MDSKLQIGIIGENQLIVAEKDTAKSFGSGLLEVFATPAMINMMENTAHKSVADFLPEGTSTVGTHVDVAHIKATPMGMIVRCCSKLVAIDGRKLTFQVEAYDESEKIGEGTHTRFIIDIQKFMSKL